MNLEKSKGGFFVHEDDNQSVRAWQVDDKWNVRVLRYGCIPGFGRNKDRDVAIIEALGSCETKSKFVFRMMKKEYEVF